MIKLTLKLNNILWLKHWNLDFNFNAVFARNMYLNVRPLHRETISWIWNILGQFLHFPRVSAFTCQCQLWIKQIAKCVPMTVRHLREYFMVSNPNPDTRTMDKSLAILHFYYFIAIVMLQLGIPKSQAMAGRLWNLLTNKMETFQQILQPVEIRERDCFKL